MTRRSEIPSGESLNVPNQAVPGSSVYWQARLVISEHACLAGRGSFILHAPQRCLGLHEIISLIALQQPNRIPSGKSDRPRTLVGIPDQAIMLVKSQILHGHGVIKEILRGWDEIELSVRAHPKASLLAITR